jgi:1,4-dihydroxy-2-naphthoate octaprenyltransferase
VRPLLAFCAVLGVLAVQVGVNLMNDVEDDARAIDRPGTLGGSGVIQDGTLTSGALRRAAAIAFGLGLVFGIPVIVAEPLLLALVAVSAFGAWGYSSGVGLKYRALGDVAVLLLCGPVLTVGFSLAAFGRFDVLVVTLGLALGFAAVGILHANNFQDMENDQSRGVRTLALLMGVAGSRGYLVAVYALALAVWPLAALLGGLHVVAALLPLLAAVPVAQLIARLITASKDPRGASVGLSGPELSLVRIDAAKVHLALGALMSLGLVVSMIIR